MSALCRISWERHIHGNWTPMTSSLCNELEQAFSASNAPQVSVRNKTFDVDQMMYDGNPVRRGKNDRVGCSYYDGTAFVPLDPFASTLVLDAATAGRVTTAYYIGSTPYDVFFDDGVPPVQVNRDSQTTRPLHVPRVPIVAEDEGGDADDEDDDLDELMEGLPEEIVGIFKCPISNCVMRRPMIAADGHTYEARDIIRWLMKKNKSPMTGKPLSDLTLRPNRALQQLIQSFKPPAKRSREDGEPSTAKKLKKAKKA